MNDPDNRTGPPPPPRTCAHPHPLPTSTAASTHPLAKAIATLLLLSTACDRRPPTHPDSPPTAARTPDTATPATPWFRDVASEAGITFRHRSGHHTRHFMPEINAGGAAVLDFDNDGRLDVLCVDGGSVVPGANRAPGHRLYRNLGDWKFEDVSDRAGIPASAGFGMGVACGDYDGDGWTDLYLLNLEANLLLRNLGNGTFADTTAHAGVAGNEWSSSAAFLDFDADGHLDLFVVNYLHWTVGSEVDCFSRGGIPDYCSPLSYNAPAMDRLFHNRGDGTFQDVTRQLGFDRAFGNGLGVATGDFDQNGWIDIFVSNDAMPNQLWLNRDGRSFDETATPRGCALNVMGIPRAGMGAVAVDLLNRGWLDIFVTHLVGEGNGLFLNNNGYFSDTITPRGPMAPSRPYTGFGVGFRDFDLDGHLDLFVANGRARLGAQDLLPDDPYAEPNSLLRGLGSAEFVEVPPPGGTHPALIKTSRGTAFGDLDNDGDDDIVIVNKDGPLTLLRNEVVSRGHWLGLDVRLAGGQVARNAMVRVDAGGRSQWRQIQPNEGYSSSSDHRLSFGLGSHSSPANVRVRWANGGETDFGPLPPDRYHRLTAPANPPSQIPASTGKRVAFPTTVPTLDP